MKKTLVVLLALMMVFAFAATAMAADEQYVPYNDIADQDVEIQTAIERLTILGALKGYDAEGTRFAPSQLITREEFATIGVRIAGMEDQVALYASMASAFKDVEEGRWSEGYINAANANGIMIGRGNGVFDPKANVTMQEVATVLLRAVGYDDRLPGAWPSDYNTKAVNVGLTEYVDYIGPKAATRAEVASLVNEAVDLNMVEYVGNDIAAGIGQAQGTVDKDGYMYVVLATNEGKVNTDLLMHSFDASTEKVTFWDHETSYSEGRAWGFDSFDKWELVSYIANDKGNKVVGPEFASLYGVSRGQDVTDLGWQMATLTLNADGEIMYVDLTSDIVRTADATKAQAKDAAAADLGTAIAEGGYGEIWYDGNDAYAAKDYSAFKGKNFGIVADVDKDGVYFRSDAPNTPEKDLDLDDNIAFYLDGEGFIDAADLEEGDVIYMATTQTGEGLALVYRPVSATLGAMDSNSIEIDEVEYKAIKGSSYYSFDKGNTYKGYDYSEILNLKLEFSDKVAFVPAYAFGTFAYFADDIQHANAGILDSYEFKGTNDRLDKADNRTIVGMNILFAGEKEPTLVNFNKDVVVGADTANYPEEGSYVEYTVNNDGEFIVKTGFTKVHDFDDECNDKPCTVDGVEGTWTTNSKLSIASTDTGIKDTYTFASNAVIYLVDSNSSDLYDIGSAQALTVDEFKELGDFTAPEMCIVNAVGTKINTLYIRDIAAEGDIAYGFGLYKDDSFRTVSTKFYAPIGDVDVQVDSNIADEVKDKLQANCPDGEKILVAYRTENGIIADVADVCPVYNCGQGMPDYIDWVKTNSFLDNLSYEMVCGDVASYEVTSGEKQLTINNLRLSTEGNDNADQTFTLDKYIAGYDTVNDNDLTSSTFQETFTAGEHVLVVYDADDDYALYIIRYDDHV